MIIKKRVQGQDIILDYRRIKSYPHGFTTYRVYKMLSKSKRIFLYTTSLNDLQMKNIIEAGYMIYDEGVFM